MAQVPEPGPIIVVKVGGSLLDWPDFPARLADFLNSTEGGRTPRYLLIAGGGAVVDVVRSLDAAHGLGDERSHRLALRAMDLTADLLAGFVAGGVVVERLEGLAESWRKGLRPILAPRLYLSEIDECDDDPLPRTWQATSDSIAARVASRLGADRLMLVKSARTSATTRRGAADTGFVDPAFPAVAAGLDRVEAVNLREPGHAPQPLDP